MGTKTLIFYLIIGLIITGSIISCNEGGNGDNFIGTWENESNLVVINKDGENYIILTKRKNSEDIIETLAAQFKSGNLKVISDTKTGEIVLSEDKSKIIAFGKQYRNINLRWEQVSQEIYYTSGMQDEYTGIWYMSESPDLVVKKLSNSTYELNFLYQETCTGYLRGDVITFTRNGKKESLHKGEGNETSLKYMQNAQNCLVVGIQECYCNDLREIRIGNQIWMADNLRVTEFSTGEPIPEIRSQAEWINAAKERKPGWCYYNNDPKNNVKFGKLYNGYAVESGNLCPKGWHIPTDEEWKILERYLGMNQTELDKMGMRGTNEGGKLKSTRNWDAPNSGANNESGFTAVPGGQRMKEGGFLFAKIYGNYWSSSLGPARILSERFPLVYREGFGYGFGLSCRCIKDKE